MSNPHRPSLSDLPSNRQLLISTVAAAIVATGILVAVVLPAEYGVDPTRIGSAFGLTEMGRIKRQLAIEAQADAAADALAASQTGSTSMPADPPRAPATASPAPSSPEAGAQSRSDLTTLTLAPDQGAEIKLTMNAGAKVRFEWSSNGGKVNFDTHADRPGVKYHPYEKGSAQSQTGELVAAFDGAHGWFWRNRTGAPVTITLKTTGAYSAVKRVA